MAFSTGVSLLPCSGSAGYNLGLLLRTAYDCENSGTSGAFVSQSGSTVTFPTGHNSNCERVTYPSASGNFYYRYLTNSFGEFNNNPFTYSIWFRSSQPFTNTSTDLIRLGVINLYYTGGFINGASGQSVLNSSNYYNYLSDWQNLVVWYDGGTLSGSLNNGIVNSGNQAYFSLYIGATPAWGLNYYGLQGVVNSGGTAFMEVDQVFTWDRVLTPTERSLVWNSGAGRGSSELPSIIGY